MKQTMVIFDPNDQYASKLSQYYSLTYHGIFQIQGFSDYNMLLNYLNSHPVEILLIDDSYIKTIPCREDIEYIYILSSQKNVFGQLSKQSVQESTNYEVESDLTSSQNAAFPHIYKYQSAKEIFKQVMEFYQESGGNPYMNQNKDIEIIGVYTPIHRSLQTHFSIVLGQLLSKDKKTIYLNFEPFCGLSHYLNKQYEHDFMDLIYFLSSNSNKFLNKLSQMTEHLGTLDYVPPAFSFLDLANVEGKIWMDLINQISLKTDYQVIILDLSEHMRGLLDILMNCNKIYTLTKEDPMANAKMAHYEAILSFYKKEEVMERTKKICLPEFKELPISLETLSYSQLARYIKEEVLHS